MVYGYLFGVDYKVYMVYSTWYTKIRILQLNCRGPQEIPIRWSCILAISRDMSLDLRRFGHTTKPYP